MSEQAEGLEPLEADEIGFVIPALHNPAKDKILYVVNFHLFSGDHIEGLDPNEIVATDKDYEVVTPALGPEHQLKGCQS
ncbi:hypothetical protein MYX06_04400 [Patescibacteria group bacterium AH-259-L05]|nr:hypothetical protein [Patescibacteria group bacterium AH-259-L05]